MTRRHVLWAVVALLVVGVLVVVASAVVVSAVKSTSIRETQTANTPLLENTNETLKIIRECTTPGEPCYDRGQRRTATLVRDLTNNLTRVSAYAAACADQPRQQSTDEIFACVVARLAEATTAP